MSAAGYIGDSFGKQWVRACAALDENPDRNILIFVDEVDKLFAQTHTSREGTAIYDLLKPLEGGILEGSDDSRNGTPYALDCDRCIFVMAGAFTGIEDIIASRIGISRSTIGFRSASENAPSENDLSEDGLRERVSLEDVETWGMPREMAGRLSTVRFLAALNEEALREIVRRNKQNEYARMLPAGARFSIDTTAEDVLVKNALEAHYGARSINQQINDVFFGALWRALANTHPVASVTLTAHNGELDFDIEQGEPSEMPEPALQRSEQERLSASAAYGLLSKTHNYLMSHRGTITLDPHASLGESDVEYAAALLEHSSSVEIDKHGLRASNDYTLAEDRAAELASLAFARLVFRQGSHAKRTQNASFPGRLHMQGKKPARCDVLSDRKRSKVYTRYGRKRRGNGQLVVATEQFCPHRRRSAPRRYGRS